MFSLHFGASQSIDFLAIGDTAIDAFIKIKDASVHCTVNTSRCELCMRFADKVPFESVTEVKAVGNSANASVAAARLGVSSALITNLGGDDRGRDCIAELKKNAVDTSLISIQKDKPTNYHYVLWYEVDRTILVNHQEYSYKLPAIKPPKWIYLSSLGGNSYEYHLKIADYLKHNPTVKLAFQPGTFQIKLGPVKLGDLYKHTEVFIVNVEEAQRILNREEKGFTDVADVKKLLEGIHALGPKLILITDGPKGAYMYDGDHAYFMPPYPDQKPPFERTGCGDAFASTFITYLIKGHTPLEALLYAPINPMSVVQYVGAQEGLLGPGQMEDFLAKAPVDYKPREI